MSSPKWQCPMCDGVRYVTVESHIEFGVIKGKYYTCRECGVVFTSPHKFNKSKLDAGKKECGAKPPISDQQTEKARVEDKKQDAHYPRLATHTVPANESNHNPRMSRK